MRPDIKPGEVFPDYELTDHTGTRRQLSQLEGSDPMILVLARGHYCPKDQQQHLELAALQSKLAVAYSQIVTISTDNIIETREFRASVGANWIFLSDAGRKVQKDLDIKEYTDPYHDPMIPHTLVLKPGLVIHSVYNGYWFWGRPSNEDLRRDLRQATRGNSSRLGHHLVRSTLGLGGRGPFKVLRGLGYPPDVISFPTRFTSGPRSSSRAADGSSGSVVVARPTLRAKMSMDANRNDATSAASQILMEFLVQFELDIPDGVAESEVEDRETAEAAAAEKLADEGHLIRLWQASVGTGRTTVLGLYRAGSRAELDGLLAALPLYEWMHTSITPLVHHPNDPAEGRAKASMIL